MSERSIFLAMLDIDDDAGRAAYLDKACAGDLALRSQVEQLVSLHAKLGTFMDRPSVPQERAAAGNAELHGQRGNGTPSEPPDGAPRTPEGPGTVIGPYKLLEQIGEGGFG